MTAPSRSTPKNRARPSKPRPEWATTFPRNNQFDSAPSSPIIKVKLDSKKGEEGPAMPSIHPIATPVPAANKGEPQFTFIKQGGLAHKGEPHFTLPSPNAPQPRDRPGHHVDGGLTLSPPKTRFFTTPLWRPC